MTRYAWTGTRLPREGFTESERKAIRLDVIHTVQDGDFVGSGLCDGVDEEVTLEAAHLRDGGMQLRVIGFLPAPQWRRRISERALQACDELVETGRNLAGRDISLVEWADKVHAIPKYPFERRGKHGTLFVMGLPRSGTGYTARRADEAGKLDAWFGLRPPLHAAPPPAVTGTSESMQPRLLGLGVWGRVLSEDEILAHYTRLTEP